MKCFIKISW